MLLFCFSIVFVGSPIARALAHRFGIIDRPAPGTPKTHRNPTAYLGGVFVFIALLAGFLLVSQDKHQIEEFVKGGRSGFFEDVNIPLVFIALSFIFFVGLIDDILGTRPKKSGLHPWLKMGLLSVGGTILFIAGIKVSFMPSDILNYPLTIFWILGITNAANVIDNMNGQSMGSGFVVAFFYFIIGSKNGDPLTIGLSLALMGTTLGFLPYNFPKASLFLGDSGSMTLGFYIAMLGMLAGRPSVIEGHLLTGTLAPIFVLMFFVFDTWFVAISRGKRKINFWWGGLDHTAHRLNNLGYSKPFSIIIIWILNVIFGLVALVIYHTAPWFAVPFMFVAFFIALRFWGWLNSIPIEEVDISLSGGPTKKSII